MTRHIKRTVAVLLAAVGVLASGWLIFASYIGLTHLDAPLPPAIGNWKRVTDLVPEIPPDGSFSFAAVGDMRAYETFEAMLDTLRKERLAFLVLLGDVTRNPREAEHQYLRAKMARRWSLPFPVFYLPGNHDVDPADFPLDRFERDYGETCFTFERGSYHFIFIRMLPKSVDNTQSLRFLQEALAGARSKNATAFVFGHCSPQVTPHLKRRQFSGEDRLCELLREYGAAYYFCGDFHGYCRTRVGPTIFMTTGGGGAHLARVGAFAFHHAVVITVQPDRVTERLCVVPRTRSLGDRLMRLAVLSFVAAGWAAPAVSAVVAASSLGALAAWRRAIRRRARGGAAPGGSTDR